MTDCRNSLENGFYAQRNWRRWKRGFVAVDRVDRVECWSDARDAGNRELDGIGWNWMELGD